MAVAVGVRAASCTTLVPSLMVEVWPASQPRGVNASDPQASAVHTESYPSRSASWVTADHVGRRPGPPVPPHQSELHGRT